MQTCPRMPMVLVSLFVDFQHNYSCMLEKEEQNIVYFHCECFKVKNSCPETCSPCMH